MTRAIPPLVAVLALGAMACSDDDPPPPGPPAPPTDTIVRPTSVQPVDLISQVFSMPASWAADEAWHVVTAPDGRILAGGSAGLFELSVEDGVVEVDPTPVRGVLQHPELGFVIATDTGLKVFDEELYESGINDMLEGTEVLSLVGRGEEIWLITDGELYELEGVALASYPDLGGVSALHTHAGSPYLVATDGGGAITLLRDEAEVLSAQDLGEELEGITAASPGPQERVLALGSDAGLYERVTVEGGVQWLPVALTTDAADEGALGIDGLMADPVGGALWLTQGMTLWRVDGGGVVSTVDWPAEVTAPGRLVATADGAVWMSEGDQLLRVGPESPPPSYAQHVLPWYDDNCANCHEPGGDVVTNTRFGDYDSFAMLLDTIIEQVDTGLMPAGDNELVGDPDLPQKWREGGMRP